MERYLRHFEQPVTRREVQLMLGISQTNAVIRHFRDEGFICFAGGKEQVLWKLTAKGIVAWERYVGVRK